MNKTALIILDGWGIGTGDQNDAIAMASTPVMDELTSRLHGATLRTDGEDVGLPHGQMGNSEVGHMNIGAGRIVYQDLLRIDRAVASGDMGQEPVLREALRKASAPGVRLHIMGLVSEGGVHSQQSHLHALVDEVVKAGVPDCVIHAFTDGRDTSPKMGAQYLANLESHVEGSSVRVASVHGRYFSMDRDKRWDRVAKSYHALMGSSPDSFSTVREGIFHHYNQGTTDEFIPPFLLEGVDGVMRDGDVVICFNFRTDRCREITMALTQESFPEHGMSPKTLHYVTMTNYDDRFTNVHVIYDKPNLTQTLGEVISAAGGTQLRMAETEKYPHVTFFFSGGREEPFEGEKRVMVPSPKVATYDLQPEMSAPELSERAIEALTGWKPDFLCLNFANPDMVGHTGVFEAVVKAVETTDHCLGRVLQATRQSGYNAVIIADHGNADLARNADGSAHTAHTTNPVPVLVEMHGAGGECQLRHGILADVAPTILDLMGIAQPEDMTGQTLLVSRP
ncbi:MAG: 2,3-bisphosphoglycerate-independent phosphoglycerate mutase [Bacteroidetes bacterium]|nr:2,3-bisphosphoglycerate-independent phosphoglycerate mutase [Bacteroidota bacterium]MDA0904469.1 2,3-bisphosphoglycerate-independent phosphoglycerate mutase [Bacteroidota bacterium]